MKNQKGFTTNELVFAVIGLLAIGGWIANIVKLAGSTFDVITGMLVLRVVGIFIPPLGAVMGFL